MHNLRCWEYLAEGGVVREACKTCVVYRVRAARCFQMAEMGPGLGHAKRFCRSSCEECVYYRRVHGLDTNVLVVTPDEDLIKRLKAQERKGMALRFARNGYEASTVVQAFLPAFAVVDQRVIEAGGEGLLDCLSGDERLPGLKIIVAAVKDAPGPEAWDGRSVAGVVEKPFGVDEIASVIGSFPVESAGPENGTPHCEGPDKEDP
ncbi:MAG: hypothetical protein ABII00_18010 [Elusimicrobiota bacterium]